MLLLCYPNASRGLICRSGKGLTQLAKLSPGCLGTLENKPICQRRCELHCYSNCSSDEGCKKQVLNQGSLGIVDWQRVCSHPAEILKGDIAQNIYKAFLEQNYGKKKMNFQLSCFRAARRKKGQVLIPCVSLPSRSPAELSDNQEFHCISYNR